MNKLIEQLAVQANANELSYAYYRGEKRPENAVTLHSVDLELFAKLIVDECFKAAMIESKGHMNPIDLMKRMKERVGVEE